MSFLFFLCGGGEGGSTRDSRTLYGACVVGASGQAGVRKNQTNRALCFSAVFSPNRMRRNFCVYRQLSNFSIVLLFVSLAVYARSFAADRPRGCPLFHFLAYGPTYPVLTSVCICRLPVGRLCTVYPCYGSRLPLPRGNPFFSVPMIINDGGRCTISSPKSPPTPNPPSPAHAS